MKWLCLFLFLPFIGQAQVLDGTWIKACQQAQDDFISSELKITQDEWHFLYHGFEELDCQKKYLQFESFLKASMQGSHLDFLVLDVLYTPLTEEVAAALNLISFCGFKNWKMQERKSVLNRICESVDSYRLGQMIYSLLQFRQNPKLSLFIGASTDSSDGSSSEKRHQIYEDSAYEKSR